MIKVIIAFDNRNSVLGAYFESCQSDISGFFDENDHLLADIPILLNSNICNEAMLGIEIDKISPRPFVFIGYCHGNEIALSCNGTAYVKKGINSDKFANSLFYTNSCLSGKELGAELIEKGCLAFIGYEEESKAFLNDEYYTISINCDNAAIKTFFSENITISTAFERMKSYITNIIDKYEDVDPIFAAHLVKNREALILLMERDIYKEDLFISN